MRKSKKKNTVIEAMLYTYYSREAEGQPVRHPVRIKVTSERKSKFYPVQFNDQNIFLTPSEWAYITPNESVSTEVIKEKIKKNNTKKDRTKKDWQDLKEAIDGQVSDAVNAKNKVTKHGSAPFNFQKFESEFLYQESKKGFFALFDDYLKELRSDDENPRIGTHITYLSAKVAFKSFINKPDIKPEEISPETLKAFDRYLRKERTFADKIGKLQKRKPASQTTIGIYMRAIKAVYNFCITKNPDLAQYYPFAKNKSDAGKYRIKKGAGHKGEALSMEQLRTFKNASVLETSQEYIAKQLWLFSFYAQGMNFKDIFYLKYGDIQGEKIKYIRRKTKDTEDQPTYMEVPLSEPLRTIICQSGNDDKRLNNFVFNLLRDEMTAENKDAVIRQKIKLTNKYLRRLCAQNDLPLITTYWARHSYATLMKESGAPIEMIREQLGHSDVRVTESYLKRFDISRKQEANEKMFDSLHKTA